MDTNFLLKVVDESSLKLQKLASLSQDSKDLESVSSSKVITIEEIDSESNVHLHSEKTLPSDMSKDSQSFTQEEMNYLESSQKKFDESEQIFVDGQDTSLQHSSLQIVDRENEIFPAFDFVFAWSHIFWLLITFGCFYYFIARIMAPRIGDIIETREGRIASDFDHAMRLKKEADDIVALYEKELAEARVRAFRFAQETEKTVKEKFEQDRKATEEQLAKKIAQAEMEIQEHLNQVMENFDHVVLDTTHEIVSKLLCVDIPKDKMKSAIKLSSISK